MPERMLPSFDGTRLYVRRTIPDMPKTIVVLVHGLREHQGRYDHLVDAFNIVGIGVYRFDHRGHGRSEGERTHLEHWDDPINDTDVVLDLAKEQNPDLPVFLLGQSMGGYAVVGHGIRHPGKIDGAVLSAPLVFDHAKLIADVPQGGDPHSTLDSELGEGLCSVKEARDAYAADEDIATTYTLGLCYALKDGVARITKSLAGYSEPVLFLHGEKDMIVSSKDSQDTFEQISSEDRQLKIYGNLQHEIFNEYANDEIIQDACRWILNRAV